MRLSSANKKYFSWRWYRNQLVGLVKCQIMVLLIPLSDCTFLFIPDSQTNKLACCLSIPSLMHCLLLRGRISRASMACLRRLTRVLKSVFPLSAIAEKVSAIWGKWRLWDRPFGVAKLRQQGSHTIFTPWWNPIILTVNVLSSNGYKPSVLSHIIFILRGSHDK